MTNDECLELAKGRAQNLAVVCRAVSEGSEGWEPTPDLFDALAALAFAVTLDLELVA